MSGLHRKNDGTLLMFLRNALGCNFLGRDVMWTACTRHNYRQWTKVKRSVHWSVLIESNDFTTHNANARPKRSSLKMIMMANRRPA